MNKENFFELFKKTLNTCTPVYPYRETPPAPVAPITGLNSFFFSHGRCQLGRHAFGKPGANINSLVNHAKILTNASRGGAGWSRGGGRARRSGASVGVKKQCDGLE